MYKGRKWLRGQRKLLKAATIKGNRAIAGKRRYEEYRRFCLPGGRLSVILFILARSIPQNGGGVGNNIREGKN